VTSLLEDRDDYLWVGHETGEVVRFKHGRFEEMPVPPGWKGKKIVAICEDELSDFWIVSDEGLMSRLRDGLLLVRARAGPWAWLVSPMMRPGHIWIARHGALSKMQHGKLVPITLDDSGTDTYVQGICPSRDGGLWVSFQWADSQMER